MFSRGLVGGPAGLHKPSTQHRFPVPGTWTTSPHLGGGSHCRVACQCSTWPILSAAPHGADGKAGSWTAVMAWPRCARIALWGQCDVDGRRGGRRQLGAVELCQGRLRVPATAGTQADVVTEYDGVQVSPSRDAAVGWWCLDQVGPCNCLPGRDPETLTQATPNGQSFTRLWSPR